MPKNAFDKFVEDKLAIEKERLLAEAAEEFLSTGVDYSVSLEQFMEDMKNSGIWDHVKGHSMIEIANIINPPSVSRVGNGKGKRLTKVEVEKLLEDIPAFLTNNPWSKKKAVAQALGYQPKKLGSPLRQLLDSKSIKKQGEKGATVYAVKGEKAKP
jgi:hypothetical protein